MLGLGPTEMALLLGGLVCVGLVIGGVFLFLALSRSGTDRLEAENRRLREENELLRLEAENDKLRRENERLKRLHDSQE
jgi:cell shape-determining protein MreC